MAVLAAGLLIFAASASADYEQAEFGGAFQHFGPSGEGKGIEQANAMAINVSGNGGVPAGSFYVVGRNQVVMRFTAGAEGQEPQFEEAWGWGVAQGGPGEAYVRCGPAYAGTANPGAGTYERCNPINPIGHSFGGEELGNFTWLAGVAVDQTTGNVYVRNYNEESTSASRKHHLIEVFTATGAPIGEGFGDAGSVTSSPRESIAEGPEKLHHMGGKAESSAIAVDSSGTVYLIDADYVGVEHPQSRVMQFKPCVAGNYENYCYASGQDTFHQLREASRIALAGSNRVVISATRDGLSEFSLASQHPTSSCNLAPAGQVTALTANEATGEVVYHLDSDRSLHFLGPCNEATGEFEELQKLKTQPPSKLVSALAVNPSRAWGPLRPPGIIYGVDQENATGDIFVPAKATPPAVLTESFLNTTTTSATLKAALDPHGFATKYRFQYLSEAAYEANEPDERQSLTVKATSGVFGLAFRGRGLGGEFTANLSAGSKVVEGLVTAKGSADLHAAKGTAKAVGAVGKGTVIAGSTTVTGVSATEGSFSAGQTIIGEGIPSGAAITAVSGTELTMTAAATKSIANATLKSGTPKLTSLTTSEGSFEVGQRVEGTGIAPGTTIKEATATTLTLSKATEKPGTLAITAGFTTLTGVAVAEGRFEVGSPVSGVGIPPETTITAVNPGLLQISKAPTKPGSAVAISSSGPAPITVGEAVEGPGIPAGAEIENVEGGKLILSQSAEVTSAGAHLHAGLPFDAPFGEVQAALEGLATIGAGNVSVSGGPGDEAGSSPYQVEFTGSLGNQDLPELESDSSGLSGGPASATVTTLHDGSGEGFVGATEVPLGGGELTPNSVGTASTSISGLSPDTQYRFRVVATSECEGAGQPLCEADGVPVTFVTYPTTPAGLFDGRAYEMVSPVQKNGGEVFPAEPQRGSCLIACKPPGGSVQALFPMQAAPNGDAVTYMGFPFSSSEGAAVWNSYVSTRTSSGWTTTAASPALLPTKSGEHVAYNAQLSEGTIVQDSPQLAADAPAGYDNIYMEKVGEPAVLRPLLTQAMFEETPPQRAPGSLSISYAGHSPDFSAQFFTANDALTGTTPFAPAPPDPSPTGRDLYEWRDGQLALVNVLPGNGAVATGAAIASASPDAHAISSDGSRVYWTAAGHLYVREDGEFTSEVHDPGSFLTASADGSQVLLSDGCLYFLQSESCLDLTEGHGGFKGIAGTGEEGAQLSHVYFVDTAVLPGTGSNERGQAPQAGRSNLYSWSEAGAAFVAALLTSDNAGGQENLADWHVGSNERTAEASPGGRFLAFGSTGRLTGYDNTGSCVRETNANHELELIEGPCKEVFLYDSVTKRLTCPSCNPTGEAPRGGSYLSRMDAAESRPWLPQPRYLTDDGRLLFDSQDRLSSHDTNGKVEDVYEYEPQGLGTCMRAGGCISLISPGTGSVDSNFLAMDDGAGNVFFTSRERLVQKDTDELIDLYDAREGGGFIAETESQRTECQGESCQPVASAPADATPASSAFHGAGNVNEGKKPKKPKRPKKKHKGKKKHGKHNRGGVK